MDNFVVHALIVLVLGAFYYSVTENSLNFEEDKLVKNIVELLVAENSTMLIDLRQIFKRDVKLAVIDHLFEPHEHVTELTFLPFINPYPHMYKLKLSNLSNLYLNQAPIQPIPSLFFINNFHDASCDHHQILVLDQNIK